MLASSPEAPPPEFPLGDDNNNNDGLPDVGCLDDSGHSAQQQPSPRPQQDNPVGPPQNKVQKAKLGDTTAHCMLSPDLVSRIRNVSTEPLDLDDRDLCLSLEVYQNTANEPPETYIGTRRAFLRRYPELKMLSFDEVKRLVATAELSGVYLTAHGMCVDGA
jgi:hypothetical protein